jgi:hypothetical protein
MAKSKKLPASKMVRVSYGLLNRPNHKGIEKKINKLTDQGYQLMNRQDHNVGCLTLIFTLGWGRGHTELTFVRSKTENSISF